MATKKQDLFDYCVSKYIAGIPPDILDKILRGEHSILTARESSYYGFIVLTPKDYLFDPNSYYVKKVGSKIECICKYYCHDNFYYDKATLKNVLKSPTRYCSKITAEAFGDIVPRSCIDCHRCAINRYIREELFLKSEREIPPNDSQE